LKRFCETCGSESPVDSDFCGECGAKFFEKASAPVDGSSDLLTTPTYHPSDINLIIQPASTSFLKRWAAPIIFDKRTLRDIGNDEGWTSKALFVFIFNYYFFLINLQLFDSSFEVARLDFSFYYLTALFLGYLIICLAIISRSYSMFLKGKDSNYSFRGIFRLACISSNWIAVGSIFTFVTTTLLNSSYFYGNFDRTFIFVYLYLFSFIFSVSVYTNTNLTTTIVFGVVVAIITWIVGALVGIAFLFILFLTI